MATAEAKAVDTKMRNIQDRADPNQMVLGGKPDGSSRTKAELEAIPLRDANAVDEQFPTSGLVNRDNKRDELMNAKIALQGAAPGVTPFGQLIAKDSDFQWLQQKREQEEYANFQVWFAQNFDKMR
jgi:hypothetical protein